MANEPNDSARITVLEEAFKRLVERITELERKVECDHRVDFYGQTRCSKCGEVLLYSFHEGADAPEGGDDG